MLNRGNLSTSINFVRNTSIAVYSQHSYSYIKPATKSTPYTVNNNNSTVSNTITSVYSQQPNQHRIQSTTTILQSATPLPLYTASNQINTVYSQQQQFYSQQHHYLCIQPATKSTPYTVNNNNSTKSGPPLPLYIASNQLDTIYSQQLHRIESTTP